MTYMELMIYDLEFYGTELNLYLKGIFIKLRMH